MSVNTLHGALQAFSALDIATQTLVAAYKGQHLHAKAFEVCRHVRWMLHEVCQRCKCVAKTPLNEGAPRGLSTWSQCPHSAQSDPDK